MCTEEEDKNNRVQHYENWPIKYTEIFQGKKSIVLLFYYFRSKLVAKPHSTTFRGGSNEYHNVRFGSKIRKLGIPLKPQFYYIKVGFKGYTFHGHAFLMISTKINEPHLLQDPQVQPTCCDILPVLCFQKIMLSVFGFSTLNVSLTINFQTHNTIRINAKGLSTNIIHNIHI